MKVVLSNNAGACFGVNRSIDIVVKAAKQNKKIATLGSLIHNPLVVKYLKNKYNVLTVKNVKEAINKNIELLVIRSHGVSIEEHKKAINAGIEVIDATCPHVKNVQKTASELAKKYGVVAILGKRGHPEVESASSYVKAQNAIVYVFQTIDDILTCKEELQKYNNGIGVVSQTTQSIDTYNLLTKFLTENFKNIEIKNTICLATKKRQNSALSLAKQVDAIIVIGGYNSSNTNHLADICRIYCSNTVHIEAINDLDMSLLKECSTVGITAGASTPMSHIQSVYEYLINFK